MAEIRRLAVVAGEETALSRVLAAHPKYVGRAPLVTDPRRINIEATRDADWKLRVIDVRS